MDHGPQAKANAGSRGCFTKFGLHCG